MPTILALKLVDATEDRQEELIRNQGQHARAIDHFTKNIGNIETVDQLMDDPELYAFVMRAYDLEDQIFGKAMMEKILKSNIEEDDALVNKLTDTRFKELYNGLGFGTDGEGNTNTISATWQEEMVARYVDRQFVNAQSEENDTLGSILEFRRKIETIEKPLDILKNETLTEFFQVALGLPKELSGLDIDRQIEILNQKFDFEDLKDPEEINRLVVRYAAIKDATEGVSQIETGATILMQSAVDTSTNLLSAVIDISTIRNVNTTYWSR
ncbi:DUF1217 domain-containing protein [Pseudooceanicola sp. LIPI14-2-Ac024]|uniref:DUF1217 domain-containing protein n=1 Tax=Pseudooceanicola sp. LIPI14-2-Ac024 TaxID=3344875 RepID=UPI0035D03EC5